MTAARSAGRQEAGGGIVDADVVPVRGVRSVREVGDLALP